MVHRLNLDFKVPLVHNICLGFTYSSWFSTTAWFTISYKFLLAFNSLLVHTISHWISWVTLVHIFLLVFKTEMVHILFLVFNLFLCSQASYGFHRCHGSHYHFWASITFWSHMLTMDFNELIVTLLGWVSHTLWFTTLSWLSFFPCVHKLVMVFIRALVHNICLGFTWALVHILLMVFKQIVVHNLALGFISDLVHNFTLDFQLFNGSQQDCGLHRTFSSHRHDGFQTCFGSH